MSDVIQYAAQMGRLDLISIMLASLTIAVALGGIFAFLEIRRGAKKEAIAVAEQHSRIVAERVANEYMQQHLPEIIKSYEELIGKAARSSVVDEIVQVQDEDQ